MDAGSLRIWDVTTGKPVATRDLRATLRGAVDALAFSPDGKHLAVGGQGGALLWDFMSDGEPAELAGASRAMALEFSHVGRLLGVGADGSEAPRILDVVTKRLLVRGNGRQDFCYPSSICFTNDDKEFFVPANKTIECFETSTGKILRTLDPPASSLGILPFLPTGNCWRRSEAKAPSRCGTQRRAND